MGMKAAAAALSISHCCSWFRLLKIAFQRCRHALLPYMAIAGQRRDDYARPRFSHRPLSECRVLLHGKIYAGPARKIADGIQPLRTIQRAATLLAFSVCADRFRLFSCK